MIINCLWKAILIGVISTGVYSVFTKDTQQELYQEKNRMNEYLCVSGIIISVSFLLLFLTSGSSESIVLHSQNTTQISHKPPF